MRFFSPAVALAALAVSSQLSSAQPPLVGPFTSEPIVAEWADPAAPLDDAFQRVVVAASARAADPKATLAGLAAPTLEIRRWSADPVPTTLTPGKILRLAGPDGVSAEARAVFASLRADLASDAPVGPVPELGRPDLLCKPAGFAFDRERAAAIAGATGAGFVRYTADTLPFRVDGSTGAPVRYPPGTLVFSRAAPHSPGAELAPPRYFPSTGAEGHPVTEIGGAEVLDRRPPLKAIGGNHACFGRVDGAWKIVLVILPKS